MKTKKKKKLTPAQYALKAAKFLETHKWIKGEEALDKEGGSCLPRSKEAASFCVIGALKAVGATSNIIQKIDKNMPGNDNDYGEYISLVEYNDQIATRKSQVINKLRKIAEIL